MNILITPVLERIFTVHGDYATGPWGSFGCWGCGHGGLWGWFGPLSTLLFWVLLFVFVWRMLGHSRFHNNDHRYEGHSHSGCGAHGDKHHDSQDSPSGEGKGSRDEVDSGDANSSYDNKSDHK